jgi:hypothetical protein
MKPNCPNWPGHVCPYPETQCGKACLDAWDGDDGYDRVGDVWVWTGRESTQPDVPVRLT